MQLYFLGTGAGSPSGQRNVTSLILDLQAAQHGLWLFDCGEASQHQMLKGPYSPRRVEKIFISHLHGDHLFGLPGMLDSRSMQGATTPLTVYGPPGLREYIDTSLRLSYSHLIYPLQVLEVERDATLFDDGVFHVECRYLRHTVPSLGFRIKEHDLPGTLDAKALTAAGIPPGPLYAHLKNGESVTLDDNRQINGADFLSPPKAGRVVAIMGDTAFCPAAIELASAADVLVHEATFAGTDQAAAQQFGHSCTHDAARVAADAQVRQLIITHLSARYRTDALPGLLAEARALFPATSMAADLSAFTIDFREK